MPLLGSDFLSNLLPVGLCVDGLEFSEVPESVFFKVCFRFHGPVVSAFRTIDKAYARRENQNSIFSLRTFSALEIWVSTVRLDNSNCSAISPLLNPFTLLMVNIFLH